MGLPGSPGKPGTAGAAGTAGRAGTAGHAGTTGRAGTAGKPGTQGPTGATGATGATGLTGGTGETGPTGATGEQGIAGTPGKPGTPGRAGTAGHAGTAGRAGTAGAAGTPGKPGTAGAAGTVGLPGSPGKPGTAGAAGTVGRAGTAGKPGTQGPTGPTGETGATGEHGGQGPTGATGLTGPTGATGATGEKGDCCDGLCELQFMTHAMTKADVNDKTLVRLIASTNPPIAFKGWAMKPSRACQEPISMSFEVPKDFDHTGDTEVDLHLLVAKTLPEHIVGAPVNIRLAYDSKDHGHDVHGEFETKYALVTVDEPANGTSKLKHYRVTIPLDSMKFYPQDLALMVIDRAVEGVNPEMVTWPYNEYPSDVYLAGMTFRYKKIVGVK